MSIIRTKREHCLPVGVLPRGLSREASACYLGISPTLFDELVSDGRMPKPKRVNSRTVWDVRALDLAFDALPDERQQATVIDVWARVAI